MDLFFKTDHLCVAHHFKVDASLHFSPCPRNIRNITKVEMCQHSFLRINSGKKARMNLEDVLYRGSPSLSFLKWTLHQPLFLYFPPTNKWTAFFRQAISVCLITLGLMLPYTFLHVPGILETLQKLRCANIPF